MSDGSEATPKPGAMFGRYKVLRKLGEGGMGVVYEAEHCDLGKRVALKTLRAHLAGDVEVVERFLREGQAAARIRHPNVVDVTDVGTLRRVPYLVMEMLDGETLAARFERGPIAPGELAALMLPVCAAVSAAHVQGVLHRDLKPDNILLQRMPHGPVRPKVLDFGIAKIFDEDPGLALTSTATALGTPYYMSPEQCRGARDVDARSDQYALGVILYEGSTGQRPFEGGSLLALAWKISNGPFSLPRDLLPALLEDFEAVVLRAMAREPSRRFASVQELGAALLPFADERTQILWADAFGPPGALSPPPARATPVLAETVRAPRDAAIPRVAPPTPPPRRARPWWPFALAGVALAGAATYRLTRAPAPPWHRAAVVATVAPPVEPPLPSRADASAEVVVTASPVVAAPPLARPARAPLRRPPEGPRPAPGAWERRSIPME